MSDPRSKKADNSQIERFREAARELVTNDDAERFKETVRKLAKAGPLPPLPSKKPSDKRK